MELQQPPLASSVPPSPRKPITIGFDENLNPNPESVSIRAQYRAQIVAAFTQHQAILRYIDSTFRKPLKAYLTPPQYQTLFGLIKPILRVYKRINKSITASASSENLERAIKDIFNVDKVGKELEILSIQYAINYRLKVVQMLSALQAESSSKLTSITESHRKSSSLWAGHSLEELLESVTGFLSTYPLLLDRLLQETPIQSDQYIMLEMTLNSVRNSAKLVADAKEGILSHEDYPEMKVVHNRSWLRKLFSQSCRQKINWRSHEITATTTILQITNLTLLTYVIIFDNI